MSGFSLYISTKLQRLYKKLDNTRDIHKKELINLCIDRLQMIYGEKYRYFSGPQTQKARGLINIEYNNYIPGLNANKLKTYIMPYELPSITPHKKPLFARPCPMTPRHGFVESRLVNSWEEILEVYKETITEEPDGEVILMRPLSGKYSGVATNAGIVWGMGNDSATNGDEGTIFIPSSSDTFEWNGNSLCFYKISYDKEELIRHFHNIGITDTNYLELVEDNAQIHIVQCRNGPSVPAQVDYVPEDITVKKVIRKQDTDGSLLEWEKYIKEIPQSKKKETVFEHVNGNLSSHWAVHAIEHNISVVCSDCVRLGDKLKASAFSKYNMTDQDLLVLKNGICRWLVKDYILNNRYDYTTNKNILYTTIATIHAMSRWDNSPHLMKLRCIAISSLIRFLCAACVGELRHWDAHGPGRDTSRDGEDRDITHMKTEIPGVSLFINTDRNFTWDKLLRPLSLNKRLKIMNSVYDDFGCAGWDSSYGGYNWQAVSLAACNLISAVMVFIRKPTNNNWISIITTINIALHTAHNNGLAVTKWIEGYQITKISETPTMGFLNPFCAEIVLGLYDEKRMTCFSRDRDINHDDEYFQLQRAA